MTFLLDTNVLSELRKGSRADDSVSGWFMRNRGRGLYISVMVLGELRKGVERLRPRDADSARALDAWIDDTRLRFDGRIIPLDEEVAEEWGRMSATDPPPIVDGLIAATAKVHGLTLVTRNVADVERTGVRCLDPFLPD